MTDVWIAAGIGLGLLIWLAWRAVREAMNAHVKAACEYKPKF